MKKFIHNLLSNASLYEKLKNDFTYHSSAIEGSQISKEDNTRILSAVSKHSKIITLELQNYKHDEVFENRNLGILFDSLLSSLTKPLSKDVICEWHTLLKQDTYWADKYSDAIGKYRRINVDVGDSINFAVSFELINEQMKNWIDDINFNRSFILEDICDFHCRFERIHPFLDGNGRIGRLIMLRQCLINNINPFLINNDTRGEYINSLRLYHQNGSCLFLVEYCKKQQQLFVNEYSRYVSLYTNRYESQILVWFNSHDILTRRDVEKIFNVKSSGAKKILRKLIQIGLIIQQESGKNIFYTLN